MAFQNDTNKKRVQKAVARVRQIVDSAESNGAGSEELAVMLRPLTEELAAIGALELNDRRSKEPEVEALTVGQRAAIKLADQASLREQIVSLIARLEAHAEQLADQS
ncbi:MAG: hypothetical protein AAGD43_24120 [Pseudomonadota bacterium]